MKKYTRLKRYMTHSVLTSILCMSMLCTGCSKSKDEPKTIESEKETTQSVAKEAENKGKKPKGKEIVKDFTQFTAPREDQGYNFETDFQFYMTPTFGSAKTEKGYYFSDNAFLYFFDPQTGIYNYMCGKPECSHKDNTCNAYAPNFLEVEYYKGDLYMVCDSVLVEPEDENFIKYDIIKVSQDCTKKDKIKEIAKVAKTADSSEDINSTYITYFQHRGYLYYSYSIGAAGHKSNYYNNGSNCLYRVSLEGNGEEECILAFDVETNISSLYVTAEGSYIYFVMSDTSAYGKLYRYNTESDKVEEMGIGVIAAETYTVLNGKIIYKKTYDGKVLYCYNPLDNTEEVFADMTELDSGNSWDLKRDTKYISVYYTNPETKEAYFLFLDYEGNYVGKTVVHTEYKENAYLGDVLGGDEYLMYRPLQTRKFMYLKKEEIGNETTVLKEAEDRSGMNK